MERAQAEQILQQALSYQQADHLQLSLHGEVGANTRFANNTITQNTAQNAPPTTPNTQPPNF